MLILSVMFANGIWIARTVVRWSQDPFVDACAHPVTLLRWHDAPATGTEPLVAACVVGGNHTARLRVTVLKEENMWGVDLAI